MKNKLLYLLLLQAPSFLYANQEVLQASILDKLKGLIPLFFMVFLIFYLLVHAPENKKLKEQLKLVESLNGGEKVLLESGLIAEFVSVKEKVAVLKLGSGEIECDKTKIIKIIT